MRWLALVPVLLAAMAPSPALAGWVRYDRVITCAAWHVFAAAQLTGIDKKANKKAIKQHEHDTGLLMEMATGLMDRPGVSRGQVVTDTQARYGQMVDAFNGGTSLAEINAKGEATCHHLSDDD